MNKSKSQTLKKKIGILLILNIKKKRLIKNNLLIYENFGL